MANWLLKLRVLLVFILTSLIIMAEAEEDLKQKITELEAQLTTSKEKCQQLETSSKSPVYISSREKVPKFNGKGDVMEWIAKIQNHTKRFTTEDDKVAFILEHLERHPRIEVRLRINTDRAASSEVLGIIREVYGSKDTGMQLQEKYFSRNQERDETLQDYSYALMEIMMEIQEQTSLFPDTDASLKERFAEGVKDKSLRRELRRLNLENAKLKFWELRDRALKWMEDDASTSKAKTQEMELTSVTEALTANDKLMQLIQDQQKKLEELSLAVGDITKKMSTPSGTSQTGNRGSITCFYCKGPNHIAKDCQKKKRKERQQREGQGHQTTSSGSPVSEQGASNFSHSMPGAKH